MAFRTAPRRRAPALALLLAAALPGCEAMDRMDYFDRFFESQRLADAAARPVPAAAAAGPVANTPARSPVGWNGRADPLASAMEPALDPSPGSRAGRSTDADDIVAMEPIPNPPAAPSRERSATQFAARVAEPTAGAAAPSPEVDAESRTRSLVRQNGWLTRFWMELTPAQQGRVARRLNRGDAQPGTGARGEAEAAWDRMGLADRAALVFGGGQPGQPPAPAEPGDNPPGDNPMVARNR